TEAAVEWSATASSDEKFISDTSLHETDPLQDALDMFIKLEVSWSASAQSYHACQDNGHIVMLAQFRSRTWSFEPAHQRFDGKHRTHTIQQQQYAREAPACVASPVEHQDNPKS